jgi:K+-transporting ATPase ATPase A chain
MSVNGILQILVFLAVLLILVKPLGAYMASVYEGKRTFLTPVMGFVEHWTYRLCGIHSSEEMGWKQYAIAMLVFNFCGFLVVYLLMRFQAFLPFNPQHFSAISPDLAFNTAISFASNTNWQAYGGESTMSYLTQMLAFGVQNFLSAATGMAILMALIRGLVRRETTQLGNFWVDMVRSILYILLPLSFILAILLASQGVIQNFRSYQNVNLLQTMSYQQAHVDAQGQPVNDKAGKPIMDTIVLKEQSIPMGPVASQVAIKQLGTNGGGFFNANSAHPLENPTPFSNFLEMLALLLIPAALCYTFGRMVGNPKQGWAIFLAMLIMFVPLIFVTVDAEQQGSPAYAHMGIDMGHHSGYPAGNMEGKETRFGIVNSALWAVSTTAASNGSVNASLDSFTPIGGLIPLWLMHLSEVVFGGVGSGLYGMLIFVILTVFIAGLMVGRTPEYLGKKIEPFEMKMVAIVVLIMPMVVLLLTAFALCNQTAKSAMGNPGTHGFTEILYAFTSMMNNNGSGFEGLNANLPFYNISGGIAMLLGRYWIAIPVLAIAGSLARKKVITESAGTLPTHTPLFIVLLICVVLLVGALTFFPALSLGPIVEHLVMLGH